MRYEADMALIRHGMTPGNEEHRYIGRTDEPLSQKGREQLLTLQKKGVYPAAACVAASPLERCRQTAELLYPGQAPCVFDQFREMDFGAFEGHNYEELKADVRYQAWIDSNGTLPFPQGRAENSSRDGAWRDFVSCLRKCGRGRSFRRRLHSSCTAERSWRFWTLLRRAVITITSAQMRKDIKDDCLWNLMQREIL